MQKLMKRLHKEEKGFTLVELMVVVVIIGILVAIAIPVYQGIQANARNSACSANVRTLSGAVAQFYTEVGIYPPASPGLSALWDGYTHNGELLRFVEEEPLCPWNDGTYTYTPLTNSYSIVCEDTMCGNFGTP